MAKSLDWRNVLAPDVVRQIEDEMSRKFAEGWYATSGHCRSACGRWHLPPRFVITAPAIKARAPGGAQDHAPRAAIGTISLCSS